MAKALPGSVTMAIAIRNLKVKLLRNNNTKPILRCTSVRTSSRGRWWGNAMMSNLWSNIKTGNFFCGGSQWWANVEMGPPDAILGVLDAYRRDTDPKKVNLSVGAYRDDNGKPWVLPSVRKAEEILHSQCLDHEYAPIGGHEVFTNAAAKLAFGEDSESLKNRTLCTVQTISGTGALRLALELIKAHFPYRTEVWMPVPSYGNHPQICDTIGIPHKKYRYLDPNTIGFDFQGALEDIYCKIPKRSIILLHASAHNPTGVDPNKEEWIELSKAIKAKKLLPFFDMAYQGFATGDVDRDAFSVRQFVKDGHQLVLCQSFSKNMGLYGERAGALTFLCGTPEAAANMMSQLKISIRTIYTSPPLYGSRIVCEILNNPELKQMWFCDIKTMADRIIAMRKPLREGIEKRGNTKQWSHITDHIGMFCYTGLKPDQVERLTKEFHIYLPKNGRISIAGLTSKNVDYVAEAMHKVTS